MLSTDRIVQSPEPVTTLDVGARTLLTLIRSQPRTRGELMMHTGLARSTLAKYLDLLMRSGLITSGEQMASTGGRPPEALAFNASAGLALVCDLRHSSARVALADLGGAVLAEREEPIELDCGPLATISWLDGRWRALLAEGGHSAAAVRAIGVGLPGLVDPAGGRIVDAPGFAGWEGHRFADSLFAEYRVPVLVESDVNLLAVGEQQLHWPMERDLTYIKIDVSIAAGMLAGGRLLRGANGSAGDIAHVPVAGHETAACLCGGRGCLAAFASGQALVRRLNELGVPTSSEAEIPVHVARGVPEAILLAREAGRAIGTVVSAMVNTVNPSTVVLGGVVADSGGPVLAAVREEIYRNSRTVASQDLRVLVTPTWRSSAVVGAARLATEQLLAPGPLDAYLPGFSAG
jgi:glucokinase